MSNNIDKYMGNKYIFLGLADSLDGGKYVLLKKSEEADVDYSVANKPRRRSKKGRKLSVVNTLYFYDIKNEIFYIVIYGSFRFTIQYT